MYFYGAEMAIPVLKSQQATESDKTLLDAN